MNIKITVATVVWNPGPLLERTLRSVEEQDHPLVEHLIIDGRSTDNTLTLLRQYQEQNSLRSDKHEITVLSEPDKGLYDAMNKALRLATGDYILFLNAGDKFHDAQVLSRVAKTASDNAQGYLLPGVIYGNTDIVDNNGQFLHHRRLVPPAELDWRSFRKGMLVCHQAFFANMTIAADILYDLKYRFSADFDWCIRIMKAAHMHNMLLADAGIIVADYLSEGMTTKNHRKSLMERLRVMIAHYGFFTAIRQHVYFVFRAIWKR